MFSVKPLKYLIFIVILMESVVAFRPVNDTIAKCRLDDGQNVDLVLSCSSHSKGGILTQIRSNISSLHCDDRIVKIDDIKFLTLENCELNSLASKLLTNFKDISSLNMSGLSLDILRKDDIPSLVKLNGNITKLDLSNNKLTKLTDGIFSLQGAVEYLNLDSNQLKEVNSKTLAGLVSLKELRLGKNALTKIADGAFIRLVKLEQLHLNDNQIDSIGDYWFNEDNEMKILDLSGNSLTEWKASPFRHLRKLEYLSLRSNKITQIDERLFEDQIYKQIEYFHINNEGYAISDMWEATGNQLKLLDLSKNKITEINPSSFANLHHLIELVLSQNRIETIQKDTFANLTQLESLILVNNKIRSIDGSWFSAQNKIDQIDLRENSLVELNSSVFERLQSLVFLDLTGVSHRLKPIKIAEYTFANSPGLKTLISRSIRIQSIDRTWFSEKNKLEEIDFSFNELVELNSSSFIHFHHLTLLRIQYNNIKHIAPHTFANCTQLHHLDLYANDIDKIDSLWFSEKNQLEVIDMAENKVVELNSNDFHHFHHLTMLKLQFNKIKHIAAHTFVKCEKLRYLDLRHNQINSLDGSWFSAQNQLEHLDLSQNTIVELKRDSFILLKNLTFLDVSKAHMTFIENGTFVSLRKLRTLNLAFNGVDEANVLQQLNAASIKLTAFCMGWPRRREMSDDEEDLYEAMGMHDGSIPHTVFSYYKNFGNYYDNCVGA